MDDLQVKRKRGKRQVETLSFFGGKIIVSERIFALYFLARAVNREFASLSNTSQIDIILVSKGHSLDKGHHVKVKGNEYIFLVNTLSVSIYCLDN